MARTAPSVAVPDADALSGIGSDRPMDQVMADLALAFALDIDLANTQADEEKWPMGRTLAFAILTSAALWALIAGLIYIII
jgi:hypothetical protein